MTPRPIGARYALSAVALHWFTLALIVAVYACILLRGYFPKGSDIREGLKAWHFALGLTVLGLVVVRLALRAFVWRTPAITPTPAGWQMAMAGAIHAALYALLIAMPIGGWLILSASGKAIVVWGISLPALWGADPSLAGQIKALHELGGTIGYGLIGLHAVAALFHHYVMRDDTLVRMLPRRG